MSILANAQRPRFKLPDSLLVCSQRCGTTWIYDCLSQHPEICTSKPKEPHFFDHNFSKGFSWYEKFFDSCANSCTIDCTAGYLFDSDAQKIIAKYLPKVKLITILRDPVERAYSHYWLERSLGKVRCGFPEALDEFTDILIEPGLYHKHLTQYLKLFSKEQILVLFFTEIKNRPSELLRKIFHFLGVDSQFSAAALHKKTNPPQVPKLVWVNDAMGAFRDLFHRNNLDWVLNLLKITKVPRIVKKMNRTRSIYPPLKSSENLIAWKYFREDIEQLEKLLNVDLSHWKHSPKKT